MDYKVVNSCVSNVGKVRKINQDNFICCGTFMHTGDEPEFPVCGEIPGDSGSMIGVFDGMGGEQCGEVASLIAAETAAKFTLGEDHVKELLRFCDEANRNICEYAEENGVDSMGTTAAVLAFGEAGITLCNIGDSKVFRIADRIMEQLSVDHYGIAPFGKKPPLSQSLGIPPEEMVIEPYVARGEYQHGDIYLLCSDGLTDMVDNDTILNKVLGAGFDKAAAVACSEYLLEKKFGKLTFRFYPYLWKGFAENTTVKLLVYDPNTDEVLYENVVNSDSRVTKVNVDVNGRNKVDISLSWAGGGLLADYGCLFMKDAYLYPAGMEEELPVTVDTAQLSQERQDFGKEKIELHDVPTGFYLKSMHVDDRAEVDYSINSEIWRSAFIYKAYEYDTAYADYLLDKKFNKLKFKVTPYLNGGYTESTVTHLTVSDADKDEVLYETDVTSAAENTSEAAAAEAESVADTAESAAAETKEQ